MKKIFRMTTIIASVTIFMTSCKKDVSLTPSSDARELQKSGLTAIDGSIGTIAKQYTLIKAGSDSLVYDASNRLVKVIHPGSPVMTENYYYGNFGEIAVRHMKDGIIKYVDTFLTNPDGKCYYSLEHYKKKLGYLGIEQTVQSKYKFTYDDVGRLITKSAISGLGEKQQYFYDATGELREMRSYVYPGWQLEKTVNYGYSSHPNRFALNPVDVNIREPYLRIFGKFNTHLPSGITIELCTENIHTFLIQIML